jgi:hypothetical protein
MSLHRAFLGHIYTHISSLARALSLTHTNAHKHYLLSLSLSLLLSLSLSLSLPRTHTRALSLTHRRVDRHNTIVSGENAHEAEDEFRHGGIYKVEPRNFACQIRGA